MHLLIFCNQADWSPPYCSCQPPLVLPSGVGGIKRYRQEQDIRPVPQKTQDPCPQLPATMPGMGCRDSKS